MENNNNVIEIRLFPYALISIAISAVSVFAMMQVLKHK